MENSSKEGFMSKQEERRPSIRFKGYTEPWEQRKLGAYLTVSKNRNVDGEYDKSDVLSVSGDYGIVNQIKFQGRSFAGASVLPYGIVETGDVVYTKSPLKANPYGIIKTNHGKNGIVSTLYAVYKVNNVSNGIFVEYYFDDNLRLNKYLKPLVNKGAKNDMKVTDENVLKGDVIFPSFPEQTAIGSFFQELDQLITLQQRELELMKEGKKTLLSKMFPKDGENFPEIRFPSFTNAWEQRKLGEVSEKVKEKNSDNLYSSVLTNSAELGIIPQRDFFDKDIANEKSLNGYYIVKQDDFVYNPRISNHAPVGPIKRNRLNEVGVMSPLYYVFRTHNIENSYLATYFDATYWHKFMKLNGDSGARADRFAIKDSLFIEMPIPFPPLPEQTAIGSFFKELDQLITLQQRELEILKTMKSTLLKAMFA